MRNIGRLPKTAEHRFRVLPYHVMLSSGEYEDCDIEDIATWLDEYGPPANEWFLAELFEYSEVSSGWGRRIDRVFLGNKVAFKYSMDAIVFKIIWNQRVNGVSIGA